MSNIIIKALMSNDLYKVKELCLHQDFEGFNDDVDPLKYILRVEKINIFTVQIIEILIDNFVFSKNTSYIDILLEREKYTQYEEKILLKFLNEEFEITEKTLALAKEKNCLSLILKNIEVDTNILNMIDKMRYITQKLVGKKITGNIAIFETDKGNIAVDRDLIFFEDFYIHDNMYSLTHDGNNNPDKIVYRMNFIYNDKNYSYFIDKYSKMNLEDLTILTYSLNLSTEILTTRVDEVPFSSDLYTLIKRDKCSIYL